MLQLGTNHSIQRQGSPTSDGLISSPLACAMDLTDFHYLAPYEAFDELQYKKAIARLSLQELALLDEHVERLALQALEELADFLLRRRAQLAQDAPRWPSLFKQAGTRISRVFISNGADSPKLETLHAHIAKSELALVAKRIFETSSEALNQFVLARQKEAMKPEIEAIKNAMLLQIARVRGQKEREKFQTTRPVPIGTCSSCQNEGAHKFDTHSFQKEGPTLASPHRKTEHID